MNAFVNGEEGKRSWTCEKEHQNGFVKFFNLKNLAFLLKCVFWILNFAKKKKILLVGKKCKVSKFLPLKMRRIGKIFCSQIFQIK
jgi:hypothetical protein